MATLKDIALSPTTKRLLMANGKLDCIRGIDRDTGWREIATACGYSLHERTPAREAYEDGYYGVPMEKP